jgi:hypothetical protein
MSEQVCIVLREGGQLTCSKADVDYHAMDGRFYGGDQGFVVYSEQCNGKGNQKYPLTVKSRQMSIQLHSSRSQSEDAKIDAPKSPRSCISKITADHDVTVNVNDELTATSDHATYSRLPAEPEISENKQMPGVISLYAAKENGTCQVCNQQGDIIRSSHICIDTNKRLLLFAYPQGIIHAPWTAPEQAQISFSSDTLSWDAQQNVLTLQDHVVINQQGLGTIINENAIHMTQCTVNGKKQLSAIESSGKTVLTYVDAKSGLEHILTCYGKVLVDHEHLQTIMESPRDPLGNILEDKQIIFQDYMGEIYADKLTIYYTVDQHAPTVTKLVLEDNVRMRGQSSATVKPGSNNLRYALADMVEFIPEAKEMRLSAKGKGRVLLYDNVNNLHVSAPSLTVRRDQTTQKDSIQGQGDVRFSFIAQEIERIKEYFHIEDKKEEKTEIES